MLLRPLVYVKDSLDGIYYFGLGICFFGDHQPLGIHIGCLCHEEKQRRFPLISVTEGQEWPLRFEECQFPSYWSRVLVRL